MSIGSEGEESRISSTLHDRSEGGIGSSRNGNCFSEKKSSNKKKLIPGEKKRGNPADSPEFGELMLRRARELISGDNLKRALEHALRAVKSFEDYADGKRCLNLVMSLHVLAAIYNNLGQHEQAVAILKRSIQITGEKQEEVNDLALAKFSGLMQLGDVYSTMGQLKNSIDCYSSGLQTQISALGPTDPRVGETCRFLAEVHLQALQLDQALDLCQTAVAIHRESGEDTPLQEIADLRLMGLICQIKGDHEAALENLIKATSAISLIGEIHDMGSLDCSIGDAFLSLARYEEAVVSYRRALMGEERNLSTAAHALVRLADLYSRMGRFNESKSHCEDALRVYGKERLANGDVASGLAELAAVYETMGEHEEAILMLKKALKLCDGSPVEVAGMEAQIGVIYYAAGDLAKSKSSLESSVSKLRNCGEKKETVFLGIALNQMGLVCVQLSEIEDAARNFLEAKCIMEREKGAFHPETIDICGNLAAAYDALGRWAEATRIMEHVVSARRKSLERLLPGWMERRGGWRSCSKRLEEPGAEGR